MKLVKFLVFSALMAAALIFSACSAPTSNDIQRERQEKVVGEGVAEVGMPSIKNFRELKIVKDLYELRDQEGLVTYTYTWSDFHAKPVFLCHSIGYGIPYATQFSASETMQSYNISGTGSLWRLSGASRLPQAEPNGLFSPASAEGTWVMCKDPSGKDVKPSYVEPRIISVPFKLPGAIYPDASDAPAPALKK